MCVVVSSAELTSDRLFQFVVGFFSFFILLCCEESTGAFRVALVPVHGTTGLTVFMLGVATAVTGLTEKAIFSLTLVKRRVRMRARKVLRMARNSL